MYVIIWEFRVREEYVHEFVSAYNSNGEWAQLFRRAEGYLGTELLRSSHEPTIFLTVDRWDNSSCFQMFQNRFEAEYRRLDSRLATCTSVEKCLGSFSEALGGVHERPPTAR